MKSSLAAFAFGLAYSLCAQAIEPSPQTFALDRNGGVLSVRRVEQMIEPRFNHLMRQSQARGPRISCNGDRLRSISGITEGGAPFSLFSLPGGPGHRFVLEGFPAGRVLLEYPVAKMNDRLDARERRNICGFGRVPGLSDLCLAASQQLLDTDLEAREYFGSGPRVFLNCDSLPRLAAWERCNSHFASFFEKVIAPVPAFNVEAEISLCLDATCEETRPVSFEQLLRQSNRELGRVEAAKAVEEARARLQRARSQAQEARNAFAETLVRNGLLKQGESPNCPERQRSCPLPRGYQSQLNNPRRISEVEGAQRWLAEQLHYIFWDVGYDEHTLATQGERRREDAVESAAMIWYRSLVNVHPVAIKLCSGSDACRRKAAEQGLAICGSGRAELRGHGSPPPVAR